jgi:hypothetical protein
MKVRRYHVNQWGAYLGYIDEVGHYFDREGRYVGVVSSDGAFYDASGTYSGRFDIQGQYWNEGNVPNGYLLPRGFSDPHKTHAG